MQSLAGVIGGEATGCDEATTAVFIECALFDPVRVALTGRRHAITSDARQRFERGIDPALMPDAVEAATHLIQRLCGGEAERGRRGRRRAALAARRHAALRAARRASAAPTCRRTRPWTRWSGSASRSRRATPSAVTVAVPSWRNDIAGTDRAGPGAEPARPSAPARAAEGCAEIEPEADLVEEVLRLRGLDTIPPVSLPRAAPVAAGRR